MSWKNLKVRTLQKTFRQGSNEITVLKNIDLDLEAGKSAAILGKSGSGKTTLLSILAGLEPADSGTVHWDDTEILRLSEEKLNPLRSRKVGIVFQQFHLIPYLTALENIELPTLWESGSERRAGAREWLERVGLGNRADHFPGQLSGGEKQRVAIARALVNRPGLVLADEPSGNLDEETGTRVMDLLFEQCVKAGSSLVLVTHDQDLAKRCDHLWWLEHGQFR